MYQTNFFYRHISFKKLGTVPWVYVKGEITNNSRRDYNTAVFRMVIFSKDVAMWNGVIKIRNLKKKQTKFFELFMIGLEHRFIPKITKYDIYFERGY